MKVLEVHRDDMKRWEVRFRRNRAHDWQVIFGNDLPNLVGEALAEIEGRA